MARFMHGGVVGARLFDPSIEFVYNTMTSGTTITLSSLDFGDVVGGRNEKWGIVGLMYLQSGASVSITSPSIGGVAASLVYSATVLRGPASLNLVYRVFTAKINAVTTGDVVFTDDSAVNVRLMVGKAINLDLSATTHATQAANSSSGSLTTSCAAGGAIIAFGEYSTGGGTPTSANFNNLTTLKHQAAISGYSMGGTVFATAQSGLNVGYNPSTSTNRTMAALSFAGI